MTKAVFRPGEIELAGGRVILAPPTAFPELAHLAFVEEEQTEVQTQEEVYTGPTVEDIKREVEFFRNQWEEEKKVLLEDANRDADEITARARAKAELDAESAKEEGESIKNLAKEEADKIIAEAKLEAEVLKAESQAIFDEGKKNAEEEGRTSGYEKGYNEGKAEVERLIQRTHLVLERAQGRRGEILEETEQDIVNLVLLLSRKVIKVISENQRDVIVNNIKEALKKVKIRGNVIVRVNLQDLDLSTEHTKEFINLVEGVKSFQIMEDPSVDASGCIIETDFGEIDARISSQLTELETKILEISPMKVIEKQKESK